MCGEKKEFGATVLARLKTAVEAGDQDGLTAIFHDRKSRDLIFAECAEQKDATLEKIAVGTMDNFSSESQCRDAGMSTPRYQAFVQKEFDLQRQDFQAARIAINLLTVGLNAGN